MKNTQELLSGKVRNALNDDTEWNTLIEEGKDKVNEHLKETYNDRQGTECGDRFSSV